MLPYTQASITLARLQVTGVYVRKIKDISECQLAASKSLMCSEASCFSMSRCLSSSASSSSNFIMASSRSAKVRPKCAATSTRSSSIERIFSLNCKTVSSLVVTSERKRANFLFKSLKHEFTLSAGYYHWPGEVFDMLSN
uniref:Uncharacterized protein n=1 Tax=Glossina austeni TaxID=7395 RepID=A0A1A9VLD4_GLOAU